MISSMRSMCVAVGLAASAANAGLVVNYTASHFYQDNLGTVYPPAPGQADTLDLSGFAGMVNLVPNVAQLGKISDIAFYAWDTGSGSSGPHDYVTAQTISLNGSPAQAINQDFRVTIGSSDVLDMFDSAPLVFNLGGGNVVTFRALSANVGPNGGGTMTGELFGEFTLAVIPLPTGAALGCAGLGLFGAVRRRRAMA